MGSQSSSPSVLALLLTISLCIVLPFTGCINDDNGGNPHTITVYLGNPQLTPRDTGTSLLYDATVEILKKTPRDKGAKWRDISVRVIGGNGSVLLPSTKIQQNGSSYGDSVEVWYSDSTGEEDLMDNGDAIIVSGMDASYEGAKIEVIYQGWEIGERTLPTDFP